MTITIHQPMQFNYAQLQWREALRRIWERQPRTHYWQCRPGASLKLVIQLSGLAAKTRVFMSRRDERLWLFMEQGVAGRQR